MTQRYAVQKNLKNWENEGYKIVEGAKRLGPEGENQLILIEKKEKVEEPLPKKEEVKNDATRGKSRTAGFIRQQGERKAARGKQGKGGRKRRK